MKLQLTELLGWPKKREEDCVFWANSIYIEMDATRPISLLRAPFKNPSVIALLPEFKHASDQKLDRWPNLGWINPHQSQLISKI